MVALVSCLAVVAGSTAVSATPVQAASRYRPRPLPQMPSVPGRPAAAVKPGVSPTAAKARRGTPPESVLPRPGSAVLDVSASSQRPQAPPAGASAGLPVALGKPA